MVSVQRLSLQGKRSLLTLKISEEICRDSMLNDSTTVTEKKNTCSSAAQASLSDPPSHTESIEG
jgi:hypothetical protein